MCLLRRPASAVLVRSARSLPERVARDAVQHSWPAYRDALTTLLEENPLPDAIDRPSRPTTVVVGDSDPETPAEDVLGWPHPRVQVTEVPNGDHLLPLRHPDTVAAAIQAVLL
jgi:pimeloyl-ACP methyl ester carboxylesterase